MTQQNPQITDADLQMLLAENPMAAEQLRRIIAERQVVELQAEKERWNGNRSVETDVLADAVVSEG